MTCRYRNHPTEKVTVPTFIPVSMMTKPLANAISRTCNSFRVPPYFGINNMPCHDPQDDWRRTNKNYWLCQACKFLEKREMLSIVSPEQNDTCKNLFDWYKQHLSDDVKFNSDAHQKEIAVKEMIRLEIIFTTET